MATNVPTKTADTLKRKFSKCSGAFQSSRLWSELPLRSFEGFESTHVGAAGNGVAGDLNNPVHSRWRVAAERDRVQVWDRNQSHTVHFSRNLLYLEGAIMLPRASPILRLSGKPPPWELDPPCHSFLSPGSLLWRSTTTWRPELNGCRHTGVTHLSGTTQTLFSVTPYRKIYDWHYQGKLNCKSDSDRKISPIWKTESLIADQ